MGQGGQGFTAMEGGLPSWPLVTLGPGSPHGVGVRPSHGLLHPGFLPSLCFPCGASLKSRSGGLRGSLWKHLDSLQTTSCESAWPPGICCQTAARAGTDTPCPQLTPVFQRRRLDSLGTDRGTSHLASHERFRVSSGRKRKERNGKRARHPPGAGGPPRGEEPSVLGADSMWRWAP